MEGPHGDVWLHSWGGYLFWNPLEEDYYNSDGEYIDHGTYDCQYCYCTEKEAGESTDDFRYEDESAESEVSKDEDELDESAGYESLEGVQDFLIDETAASPGKETVEDVSSDEDNEIAEDEAFEVEGSNDDDEELTQEGITETDDDNPQNEAFNEENPPERSGPTEPLVRLTDHEDLCDGYAAGFLERLLVKSLPPPKSVATRRRRQQLSNAGWGGRSSDTRTFADAIAQTAGLRVTAHHDWRGREAFGKVVQAAESNPENGVYLSIYTAPDGYFKHDMACAFMGGKFYLMDSKQGIFEAASAWGMRRWFEEAYKKYSRRASGYRQSRAKAEIACSVVVPLE